MSTELCVFLSRNIDMELYERVKTLARAMVGSDKALAEMLEIKQNTFSGYLKPGRQDNLWPLLPRMLALFPRLSRNWLYFDEGPMTIGLGVPLDEPVPPSLEVDADQAQRQDLEARVAGLQETLREREEALDATRAKLTETEAELREAYRTNQKLTTKLLFDDGAAEKGSVPNAGGAAASGRG